MQDTLAKKLRVLRAERGLTLREAAQQTGVDKDTLSKLERGIRHPHDVTISRLAKGYDVPVEELLEERALAGTPGKAKAPVGLGIEALSTEELREAALELSADINWNRTRESARAETRKVTVTRAEPRRHRRHRGGTAPPRRGAAGDAHTRVQALEAGHDHADGSRRARNRRRG